MKTLAIVPVKGLSQAKSRLAGALTPEERRALTLKMLDHVLQAIAESGAIDAVAVISPDAEPLRLPEGVVWLEQTRSGLNNHLEQGREWATRMGADAVMVIFADLPLVSPDDIARIVELGAPDNTVVLAPDRHDTGTNSLLAHPVSLARFAFGANSYAAHRSLHEEAGARIEVYSSPGTSLDVDTPDDLAELERLSLALSAHGG